MREGTLTALEFIIVMRTTMDDVTPKEGVEETEVEVGDEMAPETAETEE